MEKLINDFGLGLDDEGQNILQFLGEEEAKNTTQAEVDFLVEYAATAPPEYRLPTKPGKYLSASSGKIWTLREDGVWVDHTGLAKPVAWNFFLVLSGLGADLTLVEG